MAITPVYLQKVPLQALDARRVNRTLVDNPGIVTGFTVAQTSTASMSVTISAGKAFVPESSSTWAGSYHVVNDATETVTIGTANATLGRIDKVVLTVRDSYISGSNNDAIFQVVQGTAAASPQPPATPANSIVLAQISVPAAATTITTARISTVNIVDTARISYSLAPQSIRCLSTKRPTLDLTDGLRIFETDTGLTRIYFKGNWVYVSGDVTANGSISRILTQTSTHKRDWKITSADAVIRAGVVQVNVAFTRRGTTLAVPTSGDVRNQSICNINPEFRPSISCPLSTLGTGRLAFGYANSAGNFVMSNVFGTSDVAVGYSFTMGFTGAIRGDYSVAAPGTVSAN